MLETGTTWLAYGYQPGKEQDGKKFWCSACVAHRRSQSSWHEDGLQQLVMPLASEEGMMPNKGVRLQDFRSHAKSKHHQQAVIQMSMMQNPALPASGLAPTENQLKDLLASVRKNKRMPGSTAYGKRKKLRKMLFCLAEAIRSNKMKMFTEIGGMSLHHDGAEGHLFSSFAVSHKFVRRVGFLCAYPMVQQTGFQDGCAIASSLKKSVEWACTSLRSAPFKDRAWHDAHSKRAEIAEESVCQHVTLLVADAAADEKLVRTWSVAMPLVQQTY